MATSGTVKTTVLYDSYFWVEWSLSSQNTENNSSTINWSCGFKPGHQFYTNAVRMSSVYINGSLVYSGGTYSNITDYKNRTFASGTLEISHDSDGYKTFTISSFSGWMYSQGTTYASATDFELTPIPRASSVSCSTANIGGEATITISRASSNFTHTLTYGFGDLSGTIATKTNSTSVSFTLPTSFYTQIPNAQSGWGSIHCDTYNGSTLIGTKSCTFTALCNEDSCKPTLSGTVVDSNTTTIALTGSNTKLIKYYSNAKITANATARNNSTLKSQKVSCGSKAITTNSGTINGVESGIFTFSATDSRGYQTILTKELTFVEYVKLTCSMEAGMPTTAGVASLAVSGNYWNGNFGQVANTLTIQYRYKVQGGNYGNWTNSTASITKSKNTYKSTVSVSGLNYQNAYTFQVRVTDKLAIIESNEQTRKTTPIFDWSKENFNINGELSVQGNTTIQGAVNCKSLEAENIADYIVEQGTSGAWTYRKWASGVAECWRNHSGQPNVSNTWGTLYESQRFGPLNFPSGLFADVPVVMMYPSGTTGANVIGLEIEGQPTKTQSAMWYYLRAAKNTVTMTVTIAVHAMGRWK